MIEDRLITKYIYNETDTIAIRCIPEGYPLPLVEWRKVGERTPVSLSPNLTIINANRNHSGAYSCQVKTYGIDSFSPTGETEKRIEIIVQCKYRDI